MPRLKDASMNQIAVLTGPSQILIIDITRFEDIPKYGKFKCIYYTVIHDCGVNT